MGIYNKVTEDIIEKLKSIAPNRVYVEGDINKDYTHDEMPEYGYFSPDAVVEAISAEEIAEIMKLCNNEMIPVVPRGAGTGLAGAAVASEGGIVISTGKMNKILSYDIKNLTVTVQPGVLLNDLAEDCAKKDLMYPPDPGEKFATLGGNVSTNAGGMRAVKYGVTRDYVMSMEVVLPTGEITRFGGNVAKNSSGYSMVNLMIGSEGTLGFITEITLKLIPLPKETISIIVPFEDLDSCIGSVPEFFKNKLAPVAIEFMEQDIVKMAERYLDKKDIFPLGDEAGAYLLVSFDGNSYEEIEPVIEAASEMLFENGAIDVYVADTPELKKNVWSARGNFLEAILADTPSLDECDVVVPKNEIAEYTKFVNSLQDKYDVRIRSFGHAGDGNLHIYVCKDDMTDEAWEEKRKIVMDEMYNRAFVIGGQVSGEHGIGHAKMEYLCQAVGKTNIELMKGIKKVFDPNGILNPGKVCFKP